LELSSPPDEPMLSLAHTTLINLFLIRPLSPRNDGITKLIVFNFRQVPVDKIDFDATRTGRSTRF
jgi:hypothetical protein